MQRTAAVLLLAVTAAPTWADDAPPPRLLHGDLVNGKALYEKHCQSCHGTNGVGTPDGVRLSDSGRMGALTNARFLGLVREKGSKKKGKEHFKLPADVELLDTWDIIGFIRFRTVDVGSLWPDADRFIAGEFAPDQYGLERIEKSTGKKVEADDVKAQVFTMYKTGAGGPLTLVPNDPKQLDKLKRNMKIGYAVNVPLEGQSPPAQVMFALDPKTFAIVKAQALTEDGSPVPELDKQLERFVGKGDRRTSGQAKAIIKAGGGGKNFAALETALTTAFIRAAEAVTAYEVVEKDRTFGDDEP